MSRNLGQWLHTIYISLDRKMKQKDSTAVFNWHRSKVFLLKFEKAGGYAETLHALKCVWQDSSWMILDGLCHGYEQCGLYQPLCQHIWTHFNHCLAGKQEKLPCAHCCLAGDCALYWPFISAHFYAAHFLLVSPCSSASLSLPFSLSLSPSSPVSFGRYH